MDSTGATDPIAVATCESPHIVIRASAGTGKTHQLSSRYLRLLHDGHSIDRILATSFTRKAAGEILERILFRLAKSTVSEQERCQLAVDLGVTTLSTSECHTMLGRLTTELHRIRVSTLDSYFGQIARTFGLELGLPPAWEILDEHDDYRLRRMALYELLSTEEQFVRELVHLITKGEASRGISQLILNTISQVYELYRQTVPDHGVAWSQIAEQTPLTADQVGAAIGTLENTDVSSTFRAAHSSAIENARNDNWAKFVSSGLVPKLVTDGIFRKKEIPSELAAVYRPLIDHARAVFVNQVRKQTQGAYQLAHAFELKYEQIKMDHESILFNDVPQKLSALANRPDTDRLAYRMDAQIDHLMLDEFQDTSSSQWSTLLPLAQRITKTTDGSSSYFCVGDAKQAIYGWRGGQAEIIGSMDTQLENISVQELTLSRRSAQPVIDVVNKVFQDWDQHGGLGEYASFFDSWPFQHHTTVKTFAGYVCLRAAREDDSEQIATTLRSAAELVRDLHLQSPQHDIGVLVRRNDPIGELIYNLRELHVPVSEEGGNPLTDSAAVQQILSLLHLVDHPSDSVARFHVAHGPLGPEFELHADEVSTGEGGVAAVRLSRLIRRELIDEGYGPCVHRWAGMLSSACSDRELQRLEQIVHMAYGYQSRSTLRTIDFVRYVRTRRVADPSLSPVRVMTVHQSKGLEFDTVVLTSLEDTFVRRPEIVVQHNPRTFRPERICRYMKKQILALMPRELQEVFRSDLRSRTHEYLCNLYVAMTRAKRSLHMVISPKTGRTFGLSTAGLLRATLACDVEVEPDRVLYEHGNPQWYLDEESSEASVSKKPSEFTQTVPPQPQHGLVGLKLRKRGASSDRGRDTTSPSQQGHAQSKLTGADVFSASRERSLEFGTLIHGWMEDIRWLVESPTTIALRDSAVRIGASLVDVEEAMVTFYKMIERPGIKNLLDESAYRKELTVWLEAKDVVAARDVARLEVHNEQRIAYLADGKLGSGSIDRLVLARGGGDNAFVAAEIIDWKTDPATTDAAVSTLCDRYAPQLNSYRIAVHTMFGVPLKSIRTRLVFLQAGRVAEVST